MNVKQNHISPFQEGLGENAASGLWMSLAARAEIDSAPTVEGAVSIFTGHIRSSVHRKPSPAGKVADGEVGNTSTV